MELQSVLESDLISVSFRRIGLFQTNSRSLKILKKQNMLEMGNQGGDPAKGTRQYSHRQSKRKLLVRYVQ